MKEEFNCMKFSSENLRFLGLWHKKNDHLAYRIFGILIYTWQFVFLVINLSTIFMKSRQWKSFSAAFEDVTLIFGNLFAMYKISVVMARREMIQNGMDKLNREWKKQYVETTEEEKLMRAGIKFERKLTITMLTIIQVFILAIIINGISRLKRNVQIWKNEMKVTNSTIPFPYETSLPQLSIFKITDIISFVLMWIHVVFNLIVMAQSSLSADCIAWFYVYHVSNYFEILVDKFRQRSFSHSEMKKLVMFHNNLISETEDIQKVLGPIMLMKFSVTSIMICVGLFQLTQVDNSKPILYIKHIFYLAFLVGQMYLNCWFSQRLEDKSEKIGFAVYSTNWYDSPNKSTLATLRMMTLRASKPCRITVFGFVNITLTSFMTVIESAYSYFTLLRTFN